MADDVVSHAFSHGFRSEHTDRLAAYWAEAHPEAYGDVSMDEAREIALLLRSLLDAVYVLPANIKMRRGERMPDRK